MIARLVTWLLGPTCVLGCGERVYPRDLDRHWAIHHAGDVLP